MSAPLPSATLFVVYAKDIERVAEFYVRTTSLRVVETEAGFVLVGGDGFELAVVRMAESISESLEITAPPRLREETPVKCSFLVEDLERAALAARAAGGGTRPLDSMWRWRGQLHLDGFDPEGNPVQLRQIESEGAGHSPRAASIRKGGDPVDGSPPIARHACLSRRRPQLQLWTARHRS